MGRLRSRWVRWLAVWTVPLFVVAAMVAFQAMASLADAQQRCFFNYPAVACPAGDDPRVAQLTFAFFGVPVIWLVGVGLIVIGWAVRHRGDHRTP
jgi:hypothetical protein